MSERAITDILNERARQEAKWGVRRHYPDRWLAIATEELGEAAKADLKEDWENYRAELVQLAAVAMAAIECLDANGPYPRTRPIDDDFFPLEVAG